MNRIHHTYFISSVIGVRDQNAIIKRAARGCAIQGKNRRSISEGPFFDAIIRRAVRMGTNRERRRIRRLTCRL